MIITKAYLSAISPNHSKYSRKLHEWLTRRVDQDVTVYITDDLKVEGKTIVRASTYLSTSIEPEGGWLHGVELKRALVDGGRARVWAYPPNLFENRRIVASFWDDYKEQGVCLTDRAHEWHDERWDTSGDSRRCRWCGLTQVKVKWVEMVERERWESQVGP